MTHAMHTLLGTIRQKQIKYANISVNFTCHLQFLNKRTDCYSSTAHIRWAHRKYWHMV